MILSSYALGVVLALASAFIWSSFPLITSGQVAPLSPLLYAGISTFLASVLLVPIVALRPGGWSAVRWKDHWWDIFMLALLNGAVFHGLVFFAARHTSPGNVMLLLQMELLFSVIILRAWGKESLRKEELAGAVLMFVGALIILAPAGMRGEVALADLSLLVAAAVPPVANVHAKRARAALNGTEVICLRSLVAALLLLPLAAYSEELPPAAQILDAWPLLLMNGFLIMAIGKLAWLEAIHRIPISVAVAVGSSAPAMTLLLSFVFLGIFPTLEQCFALVLMSGGILVMTTLRRGRRPLPTAEAPTLKP